MATVASLRARGESYLGLSDSPEDFDAFWQARVERACAPREVGTEPVGIETPLASYMRLGFDATDGVGLHARAIVPKAPGEHPCVLVFHDADRGPRGWHHLTRFVALGYAVVELECRAWTHDVAAGWQGGPGGLELAQLIDDALACASVAAGLGGVDAMQLATWGEGLGGALSIEVAALLPQGVSKCAALNPAPADFRGAWESGVPASAQTGVTRHFREEDPTGWAADGFFSTLAYVDAANFSPRLSCELLLGTSLMDQVAPPLGQYALFNRASCPKEHVTYPKHAHERVNDFENRLLAFLLFGKRQEITERDG